MEKQIKKLIGVVIKDIIVTKTNITIQQMGGRDINIPKLLGKQLVDILPVASFNHSKIDVSRWANDDSSIPAKNNKEIDYGRVHGETIVSVGHYQSIVNAKARTSVSITCSNDPENSNARTKTIAFGMYTL